MKQSCTSTFRRSAAVGAAVAIVAASSAFGIGATAAVADTADAATSSTTEVTPTAQPGGTTDPAAPVASPAPDAPDGAAVPGTPAADPAPTPSPDPAGPVDPIPAHTPTPTPAPAAPAGTESTTAASVPVTWSESSSPEDRIVLHATAGEPFSHTFVANGGDRPLEYLFNPHTTPPGLHWDEKTGVLSGTLTNPADSFDIDVAATDQYQSATQYVRVEIQPGAAAHIGAQVYSNAEGRNPSWSVAGGPDGGIAPIGGGGLIDAVPVGRGGSLWVSAVVTDRIGTPLNGTEMPSESTLTSDDPDDVLRYDDESNTWKATFDGTGPRQLTLRSEGLSLSIPVDVADTPLAFTEQSSSDAPLDLTATSGTPFSHRFSVQGATGPVEYSLAGSDGGDVIGDGDFFRSEFSIDPATGVLSGTPRPATQYDFEVIARSGSETATAHVTLTVEPGAPVGVLASVYHGAEGPEWEVAPDGSVTEYTIDAAGSVQTKSVDSVPADQGIPLFVKAVAVDANGNRTTTPGSPHPVVTSDVSTDRITWVAEAESNQVDFPHASIHTLTVSNGGVTTSFRVDVRAHADAAGSSTTRPASGTLAYTGADESGPLAWALGLLAAGGGLLVHRLRRRRA
ncbi:putative Ig domain-containing protein [Curtobacterium sp. WHRI 8282]|uniref:putative Ig domain-containing protein n=1 Tax=Curtobacterium sp. WHRI 8282 TaxID=3162559 RepID=UPI0032ED8E7F